MPDVRNTSFISRNVQPHSLTRRVLTVNNLRAFTVSYQQHLLKGDICPGQRSHDVLCIHGAGRSDRTRYSVLRSTLQKRGFGSVSFDCLGHGETGGLVEQSSLISRTGQAQAILQAQALQSPLSVIGQAWERTLQ